MVLLLTVAGLGIDALIIRPLARMARAPLPPGHLGTDGGDEIDRVSRRLQAALASHEASARLMGRCGADLRALQQQLRALAHHDGEPSSAYLERVSAAAASALAFAERLGGSLGILQSRTRQISGLLGEAETTHGAVEQSTRAMMESVAHTTTALDQLAQAVRSVDESVAEGHAAILAISQPMGDRDSFTKEVERNVNGTSALAMQGSQHAELGLDAVQMAIGDSECVRSSSAVVEQVLTNLSTRVEQGMCDVEAGMQLGRDAEAALGKSSASTRETTTKMSTIAAAVVEQSRRAEMATVAVRQIADRASRGIGSSARLRRLHAAEHREQMLALLRPPGRHDPVRLLGGGRGPTARSLACRGECRLRSRRAGPAPVLHVSWQRRTCRCGTPSVSMTGRSTSKGASSSAVISASAARRACNSRPPGAGLGIGSALCEAGIGAAAGRSVVLSSNDLSPVALPLQLVHAARNTPYRCALPSPGSGGVSCQCRICAPISRGREERLKALESSGHLRARSR